MLNDKKKGLKTRTGGKKINPMTRIKDGNKRKCGDESGDGEALPDTSPKSIPLGAFVSVFLKK